MRINQDNYEQFFLDHAEGNLSPEMEKELADFLAGNPDLKPILEEYDPSPLPNEEINNSTLKKRLKKNIRPTSHINEDQADEWMIRDIEGLLDEANKIELNEFLSLNPAYGYDYKLFGQTKLVPDITISYRRKNELKKKGVLVPASRLLWIISAAAAVILLIIGIRFFQSNEVNPNPIVNLPVADIPDAMPLQTSVKVSIPETKKEVIAIKQTSEERTNEISRVNSFRMKPVNDQASIAVTPSVDEPAINIAGRKNSTISIVDKKEPSLIARAFDNILNRARDGISKQANFDRVRKPDLDFWSIAKAGIEGFNSISDRELELYVRKDEDGKVKSYALVEQERLILAKELKKE